MEVLHLRFRNVPVEVLDQINSITDLGQLKTLLTAAVSVSALE